VERKSKSLFDVPYQYCRGTGCTHNTLTLMLGEIIDELGIRGKTILVGPVGCSEQIINYVDVDAISGPHGRAVSLASAIKRLLPDRIVITFQGDGDFASIGIAEAVHTAARGEKILTIWVNNGLYAMTGGQMSVTTLPGQKTSTSPAGRNPESAGSPLHVSELLAGIENSYFVTREAVNSRDNIDKCKAAIIKGIKLQMAGCGYNAVEVLGVCPTNWHLSPKEAMKHLEQNVMAEFPLGVKKDKSEGGKT
jgi:2-oxoglutarate/2-oxoacid ferredoxin oxidoreductase subunit beta